MARAESILDLSLLKYETQAVLVKTGSSSNSASQEGQDC